jgi:prephenate dehydratase
MVSEKSDPAIGAIGSQLAADIYGLQILCEGIETEKKNYTRFLVLNHHNSSTVKDFDKVSISFTLAHEVGSLHGVLKQLILHKANMSKIQSTPILGKPWEYRFFIDFVTKDPGQLELLIPALQAVTHDLLILGTYKSGNHYEDTTIS